MSSRQWRWTPQTMAGPCRYRTTEKESARCDDVMLRLRDKTKEMLSVLLLQGAGSDSPRDVVVLGGGLSTYSQVPSFFSFSQRLTNGSWDHWADDRRLTALRMVAQRWATILQPLERGRVGVFRVRGPAVMWMTCSWQLVCGHQSSTSPAQTKTTHLVAMFLMDSSCLCSGEIVTSGSHGARHLKR